jgi:hypothetical protein
MEGLMKRTVFELWTSKINGVADHTYIACPENNSYFDCWGGHDGKDKRKICTGNGIYEVANCYRKNAFGIKDTAGIGLYGINGVCHQSANCFLYTTEPRVTLDISVRGYFATVLTYGPYGTEYLFWKAKVYNPCVQKYFEKTETGSLFNKLNKYYTKVKVRVKVPLTKHQFIIDETAIIATHFADTIDTGKYSEDQSKYLKEKDSIIAKKMKSGVFAKEMNQLSVDFQKTLASRIGKVNYEKLTGLKAGETVNIIDPEILANLSC